MTSPTALAPAKVNLFLHVGPVDADGYHPLASLVAFADVGDRLSIAPADRLSLAVEGRFSAGLAGEGDNLVLRALRALGRRMEAEPALAVTLDKALPIAAGLGGGSSDAGTALKLARDQLAPDLSNDDLAAIAAELGADGAMCVHARAAWAEGRGGVLTFEPRLPPLPVLLVNPGVPSPTGAVYRAYDGGQVRDADMPSPPVDWSVPAVIDWLAGTRNDLQPPAVDLAPEIGQALNEVVALPGVRLTRMSGSGATVFALFDTPADADAAGRILGAAKTDWWISSTVLS